MKFDLNLLRVLQAIYETRNITTAATMLKVSQPAASAALARLRHAFNDPLFIRSPMGMEPTPRTQSIIDKTREVLESIDQDILSKPLFDPLYTHDEFVFCLTAIAEYVFLPHLYPVMRQQAPASRIRSITLPPQDLQDALLNGKVDLAIGFYPDLVSADIYQQRLFSHNLVCLVREGHPIATTGMTLDAFLKAEHIEVKDGSRSSEMFERALSNRKIERNIVLTTSHFMSIPRVIASSDLIAVAPLIVAKIFAGQHDLKTLPLPLELPEYDLKQYWHRKFHHDTRLMWLRKLIQHEFPHHHVTDMLNRLNPTPDT